MEKIRNIFCKDWQHFILKETFLVYPALTNFTQRKRKTYDAMIYQRFHSLEKCFIAYIQEQQHEMILSYAKPLNEKIHEYFKYMQKKKKYASDFSTLSIDDMKTKKKLKSVLLV